MIKATYQLLPNKETKGCYRYGHLAGDAGVTTIYIRKEAVDGPPPRTITVSVDPEPGRPVRS